LLRYLDAAPSLVEQEFGRIFVVARVDLSYHKSANLDDLLDIQTQIDQVGRVKMTMAQSAWRGDLCLVSGVITVGVVDSSGRPAPLPPQLRDRFSTVAQ
jgi:acyl-CoA thioester hydrolase